MTALDRLLPVPAAADPAVDGELVRRAVPNLGRGWAVVAGQVSCVLSDIVRHTVDGPERLWSRQALHAWTRLGAAIDPTQRWCAGAVPAFPQLGFVTVAVTDVAALGTAARELGRDGHAAGVHAALIRSAAGLGRTPEHLVELLGRVHGVLDLDLGPDGETLRTWGADGPVFVTPPGEALAAHRRIAMRVHSRWRATRRTGEARP